ncbi:unnamed protein product [Rangifer tarandus platyrhynchus]|uniref:Uncharacterized protein n=2 Tax=Rangifer tarandus platyrhynchus TaxID=3082113 RepID=A0ABN8ZGB4_RANTA|nr:unnamed protein product [Rangifer tarandus platyrhynchus]
MASPVEESKTVQSWEDDGEDQRTDGVPKEGGCPRHSFPKRDRSRGGAPGSEAGPPTPIAAHTQGVCSKSKHLLRSCLLHHLSGDGGCSAHCLSLECRQAK